MSKKTTSELGLAQLKMNLRAEIRSDPDLSPDQIKKKTFYTPF